MSKASKRRRRAEKAQKQKESQQAFGFGRVLADTKKQKAVKRGNCPRCGTPITFDKITLTIVLQGLPCCGYVLSKHSEVKEVVQAHLDYKERVEIEAASDRERAWHRSQPRYDNGDN